MQLTYPLDAENDTITCQPNPRKTSEYGSPCPLGCNLCNSDGDCITCLDGNNPIDGKCEQTESCLQVSVAWNDVDECEECDPSCRLCEAPGDANSCLSCHPGYIYNAETLTCHVGENRVVDANIPIQIRFEGTNLSIDQAFNCPEGCTSCSDKNSCDGDCLSGWTKNDDTMLCEPVQNERPRGSLSEFGSFYNWTSLSVEDCDESCAGCLGHSTHCTECAPGYIKVHKNILNLGPGESYVPTTCSKCPIHQYVNSQGNCVNTSGQFCGLANKLGECILCSDLSTAPSGNTCVDPAIPIAPKGYYYDPVAAGTDGQFKLCSGSCLTCINATDCTSCRGSLSLDLETRSCVGLFG
jgi:hypothetical protein